MIAPRKWYVPFTIVCLLSGMLLSMQLRVQANLNEGPKAQRNESLIGIIQTLEEETAALEDQLVELRSQLDEDQKRSIGNQDKLLVLQEELEMAKAAAGLSDLVGPGVIITLEDNVRGAEAAKNQEPGKYRDENFIIHDRNLLYIVNDLKVGGAEAIAINGQRLVTTSDIRCAGTMILVNTTRLAPPYIITAIGDPDSLVRAVTAPEAEYETLKALQFPVSLKVESIVEIPAYKGGFRIDYAQPAKEGEE